MADFTPSRPSVVTYPHLAALLAASRRRLERLRADHEARLLRLLGPAAYNRRVIALERLRRPVSVTPRVSVQPPLTPPSVTRPRRRKARRCTVCGNGLAGRQRLYCGPACCQKAYRQRKGQGQ